ncbi:MAG TPA: hypothetical protein VI753_00775, partial [Anaerolineales bacterium]|nr:hypothetical protein [Anaerolineales bacterium]
NELTATGGVILSGLAISSLLEIKKIRVGNMLPGLEDEALDKHTLAWAERVNNSGGAYLTPAILDGRWMVRVSIGAIPTERQHVDALWALMRREAEGD